MNQIDQKIVWLVRVYTTFKLLDILVIKELEF